VAVRCLFSGCGTGFLCPTTELSSNTILTAVYGKFPHVHDTSVLSACGISQFSDGTGGGLGFTVASPAYDQAFDPPAFLGVSGVDFTLQVGTSDDRPFPNRNVARFFVPPVVDS